MPPAETMRWASATSELPDPHAAAEEVAAAVREALGGEPDLGFLFFGERRGSTQVIAGAVHP